MIDEFVDHLFYELVCAVAFQQVVASIVDNLALLVHYVVVVEDVLAHFEVARLDLFLRAFDRLGDHAVLDDFALFSAQLVHNRGDAIGAKQTH